MLVQTSLGYGLINSILVHKDYGSRLLSRVRIKRTGITITGELYELQTAVERSTWFEGTAYRA